MLVRIALFAAPWPLIMAALAVRDIAQIVGRQELCFDLAVLPWGLVQAFSVMPASVIWLILLNAFIGGLFNVMKIVQLLSPFLDIFSLFKTFTHSTAEPPVTAELLTKACVIPAQEARKLHTEADCMHIDGKVVQTLDVCKHCRAKVLKRLT